MKYLIFFILLFAHQAYSQTFIERDLNTSINEVTVYLQGGLISRSGASEIPKGKSLLKIKSLSPHIDQKSIQVKGIGEFTILSVNHKQNYINSLKRNERIENLNEEIKSLELAISTSQSRLDILNEKQSVLNANKNLGGDASGASLVLIKQAIEFYDKELSQIKSEEISTKLKIRELQNKKARIEQEIADTRSKEDLPTGEIEIRIESPQKTTGKFIVTYLVANTGWYPKYNVRVTSVDAPIELAYKADIFQNTGVDWENVKLKLSNGNPNQSGVAPELRTWYLNYARYTTVNRSSYGVISSSVGNVSGKIVDQEGVPIPGATVVVKGTTVGTVTDIEGNYSLTLPMEPHI